MVERTLFKLPYSGAGWRLGIVVLASSWLMGCQDDSGSSSQPTSSSQAGPTIELGESQALDTDPSGSDSAAPGESQTDIPTESNQASAVTVTIQDWQATEELIARQKGKVVVLDLWSTACEPCVREFPNLVALHNQYGADKVVCISGSCDYEGLDTPEELLVDVREFLVQQQATFHNVLFNIESDQLSSMLKFAAIPVVYVYGPDGKVAKRFDNESGGDFTYKKDIIPFVEELLAAAKEQE